MYLTVCHFSAAKPCHDIEKDSHRFIWELCRQDPRTHLSSDLRPASDIKQSGDRVPRSFNSNTVGARATPASLWLLFLHQTFLYSSLDIIIMPAYSFPATYSLYSSRNGLMTPAGLATQVPLNILFDRVLPPLPAGLHLGEFLSTMNTVTRKTKYSMPVTQQGRRRGFPNDPAVSSRSEETSFLQLKRAVSDTVRVAVRLGNTSTPGLEFYNNVNCIMDSAARTSTALPDSYFLRGGPHIWSNIGVCGEYKKTGTEADIRDVRFTPLALASRSSSFQEQRKGYLEHGELPSGRPEA